MRILILGGTIFLGRHLSQAAIRRGHRLSLFNRGESNPELFPEVETFLGDRDGGLEILKGNKWDAVIDTSGYLPRLVRDSALALSPLSDFYVFVSSISVYKDLSKPQIEEGAPVAELGDSSGEEISAETYGPLKALCEKEVQSAFPGRALIVRPGLIVGPYDPTDRFTYWPHRLADGGEVLAPSPQSAQVQFIDVRDLAEWILNLVEIQQPGLFNATGPRDLLTMRHFLEVCRLTTNPEARLIWVGKDFLLANGLVGWIDLPLWLPDKAYTGMLAVDIRRAISAGLAFRALEETIRTTLEWSLSRPPDHQWRAGLERSKEEELLARWHRR